MNGVDIYVCSNANADFVFGASYWTSLREKILIEEVNKLLKSK
jgi:hypothetical protein